MGTKLTPEKLTAFCAALAETCNVGKAASAVGISRYTAYIWRKEDSDFAARWDDAMKAGLLMLEDEAHRRAFDGVAEPLTHQGRITYQVEEFVDEEGNRGLRAKRDAEGNPIPETVRKYSDTLAIFLLKAHAPDKYRENSKVELAGRLTFDNMSDDDIRAELAALTASGAIDLAGMPSLPPADDDCSDLV